MTSIYTTCIEAHIVTLLMENAICVRMRKAITCVSVFIISLHAAPTTAVAIRGGASQPLLYILCGFLYTVLNSVFKRIR